MKKPKIAKIVTTKTSFKFELSRYDLLNMARKAGHVIPDFASVEFYVPGGGDWSNTAIDIDDDDNPVVISWTEQS